MFNISQFMQNEAWTSADETVCVVEFDYRRVKAYSTFFFFNLE